MDHRHSESIVRFYLLAATSRRASARCSASRARSTSTAVSPLVLRRRGRRFGLLSTAKRRQQNHEKEEARVDHGESPVGTALF